MPGGTLAKLYRPASFVDVVRGAFVATSSRTTSAPGTAAFCWSVTWPETVPVEVDCAQADVALMPSQIPMQATGSPKKSEDIPARPSLWLRFITPPPLGLETRTHSLVCDRAGKLGLI